MEKEIYYCLSDNGDLSNLYLANIDEVKYHILNDIGDVDPNDLEDVVYTIKIVKMTSDEFASLPEYEF